MASGGACSSSPSAERLPPPFPGAEGDADSDTEGEDIFTGAVSPLGPRDSRALLRRCPRVAPARGPLESSELPPVGAAAELSREGLSPKGGARDAVGPRFSAPLAEAGSGVSSRELGRGQELLAGKCL